MAKKMYRSISQPSEIACLMAYSTPEEQDGQKLGSQMEISRIIKWKIEVNISTDIN